MDTSSFTGVRVTGYRWARDRERVRLVRSQVGSLVFVDEHGRGVMVASGQVLSVPDGFLRFATLVGFREMPAKTVEHEIVVTKKLLREERSYWIVWQNVGTTHRVLLSDIVLGTQFTIGRDWRHEPA